MNPLASHERFYRFLLRLYPARFRARFGDDMVQLFSDQLRDARAGRGMASPAGIWLRTLGDLAVTALSEHARGDRTLAHSVGPPPTVIARLLGAAGILGGFLLVVAFVPNLPWTADTFNARLVVLNGGAIAIAVALYRRLASVARWPARLATAGVIVANATHLLLIVLIIAQPGPPHFVDFQPHYDRAISAMWLAGALYGLEALSLGGRSRWAALCLMVGSILAFGPLRLGDLGLVGVALVGTGWILFGLDVATRQRMAPRRAR